MKILIAIATTFFSTVLAILPLHAQLSSARVVYHADHSFVAAEGYNGQNSLHFNLENSLFVHDGYPKESTSTQEGNNIVMIAGDPDGLPVFIDYRDSLIYTKRVPQFPGSNIQTILKEPLEKIEWSIESEQKKIAGYNAIRATCKLEGRDYEAWFTPDIPVRYGPYHLNGLPGLILEATSVDGKVSWKFVGYESKTTQPVELAFPKDAEVFTWDEFVAAKRNYKRKKESQSTSTRKISIGKRKGEYHIELGKFDNIYEENH